MGKGRLRLLGRAVARGGRRSRQRRRRMVRGRCGPSGRGRGSSPQASTTARLHTPQPSDARLARGGPDDRSGKLRTPGPGPDRYGQSRSGCAPHEATSTSCSPAMSRTAPRSSRPTRRITVAVRRLQPRQVRAREVARPGLLCRHYRSAAVHGRASAGRPRPQRPRPKRPRSGPTEPSPETRGPVRRP